VVRLGVRSRVSKIFKSLSSGSKRSVPPKHLGDCPTPSSEDVAAAVVAEADVCSVCVVGNLDGPSTAVAGASGPDHPFLAADASSTVGIRPSRLAG